MKAMAVSVDAGRLTTAMSASAASADDRKTVADLDVKYQAAVKANDADAMDRILAMPVG